MCQSSQNLHFVQASPLLPYPIIRSLGIGLQSREDAVFQLEDMSNVTYYIQVLALSLKFVCKLATAVPVLDSMLRSGGAGALAVRFILPAPGLSFLTVLLLASLRLL